MKNFEFNNPTKILFGKESIKKIGKELSDRKVKKVLMIYGKSSIFKTGVYDQAVASLKEAEIEWVEFGGIKPNPVLSKVHEAIEICRKENIEGILAIGGGSVIDTSKAVSAGTFYDGDIWELFGKIAPPLKALPIFTILTISATGSEMNPWAVITNEEEHKKWSLRAGMNSYPKVSIIDPSIQKGLPPNQTANGIVDSLSHLFEQYFESSEENDLQDEMIEGIMRTVMKHGVILMNEPTNYESRAQLAWSSTLALNGLMSLGKAGGDWASHALEHSLSAYYDVAHGVGLAIIFPAWMKYVSKENNKKFVRFAEKIFNLTEGTDIEKVEKAIAQLKMFFQKLGVPTSLSEINISKDAIDKLTENAALSLPLGKYKKLNKSDIKEIYTLACS